MSRDDRGPKLYRGTIFLIIVSFVFAVGYAVYISVTHSQAGDDDTQLHSEVSYKLHANPADPLILSAEIPDGDVISMLGNKSTGGEPQSIDEFIVKNKDGETFVFMNDDGIIESAEDSNGFHIDFIWDQNQTSIYTSLVLNNGSQQLSIKINLSEPLDENFTDIENDITAKRSLSDTRYRPKSSDRPKTTVKRQSDVETPAHASVFVSVQSCNVPESNAIVFADVLLDYDQGSGTYEDKTKYWGLKTTSPGEYEVRIPTSKASGIGKKIGNICDKIDMHLDKICSIYSVVNGFTKSLFGHDVGSILCFKLRLFLRFVVFHGASVSLSPFHRFCKNIFKPLKIYCKVDEEIPHTNQSAIDLICNEGLQLVDNGIDLLREKDIYFTPTAIIPSGNRFQATGQVLSIRPGTSTVPQRFTIVDQEQLRITDFNVVPFDPMPGESYRMTVTYKCYSNYLFSATMTIVGTDGYYNTIFCYTGPSCVLFVPGAETLVRDDVEIHVQNNQTTISRMVIVIF